MERALVVAGLLVLSGCAFPAPPPPVNDTSVVAASPDLVLARARRWFLGHGFEIEKTLRQRDGGRVVAARQPFQEAAGYARCAWAFKISGGVKPAARVTVIATAERSGRTRVTAKVEIALVNTFGDRAQCASHGALEQEILAAVAASG